MEVLTSQVAQKSDGAVVRVAMTVSLLDENGDPYAALYACLHTVFIFCLLLFSFFWYNMQQKAGQMPGNEGSVSYIAQNL